MSLSGTLRLQLQIFDDGDLSELFKSPASAHEFEEYLHFTDGTSNGQIDVVWSDTTTIVASATTNHDLAGSKTDPWGRTITFTTIKLLAIRNKSTTTGDILNYGPGASNGWLGFWAHASDRNVARPSISTQGCFAVFYDPVGINVTAGTGDILSVIETGGANTVTYDLVIAGEGTLA